MGLALGDALGAAFEGMPCPPAEDIEAILASPPHMLCYTDDTEMAIGVAESLISGMTPESLAERFAKNFHAHRGYGRGTRAIIGLLEQGTPWHKANRAVFAEGSYGNGAAMRVAPVGLRYHANDEKLMSSVRISCMATHTHPLAIEGALVIAKTTALAVNGEKTGDIPGMVREIIRETEFIRKADAIKELLRTPPSPREAAGELGCSVKADESVPAALLAFLLNGDDYAGAVRYAIEMGGDTDTIAAMAGAMSGAMAGDGALPDAALSALEGKDRLESIARTLHDMTVTVNEY